jgi:hypothetical protein
MDGTLSVQSGEQSAESNSAGSGHARTRWVGFLEERSKDPELLVIPALVMSSSRDKH